METRYRPDIDGLRAVAVLGVLLFHFGIPGFPGGFVGVDVFFVISGFLITRLIVDEASESGTFSFANFYLRRARRLLPAMLTTFLVCFIVAFLLFSPPEFERFAGSLVYALFSLSNFYFWQEAGYFDAAALTKPLLHTWSLAVEEQFYFIWPTLLVLLLTCLRQRYALAAIVALALLSLACAEYLLSVDPAAAFYLLPARGVELAIGAMMVWVVRLHLRHELLQEVLLALGLALILAAVLLYDAETPFPGVSSLVPCAGAALAIYAGRARILGLLLRNPVSVWVGRASYSIYLVHWPLLVFYGAYTFREPTMQESIVLLIVSLALGWLQYRFIEQRYRYADRSHSLSPPAFGLASALLVLLLMLPASTVWATGGAAWRIPEDRVVRSNAEWLTLQRTRYCSSLDPAASAALLPCQNFRNSDQDLFIWGDSHAQHLVAGVSHAFPDHNVYVAYSSGCVTQNGFAGYIREHPTEADTASCINHNKEVLELLRGHRPSAVIVTSAKRHTPETVAPAINYVLDEVAAAGHRVIYLADFIRPSRMLAECGMVPGYVLSDRALAERCTGVEEVARSELAYNDELSTLIAPFVDIADIQCPRKRCRYFAGATPLYRDDHHLSTAGSIRFLRALKEKGRLSALDPPST